MDHRLRLWPLVKLLRAAQAGCARETRRTSRSTAASLASGTPGCHPSNSIPLKTHTVPPWPYPYPGDAILPAGSTRAAAGAAHPEHAPCPPCTRPSWGALTCAAGVQHPEPSSLHLGSPRPMPDHHHHHHYAPAPLPTTTTRLLPSPVPGSLLRFASFWGFPSRVQQQLLPRKQAPCSPALLHGAGFSRSSAQLLSSSAQTELASGMPPAHRAVVEALAKRVAPPKASVLAMLDACGREEDLQAALQLLARLRLDNAAVRKQLHNFREHVTESAVHTSLRLGSVEKALAALHPRNPYGLSFSLPAAQAVLRHAREQKNAKAIHATMNRMRATSVPPSSTTIDLAVRGLLEAGAVEEAVALLGRLVAQGLGSRAATLDTVWEAVVAKALPKEAEKTLSFLEALAEAKEDKAISSDLTPQAAVKLTLAHVLCGQAKDAAAVVSRAAAPSAAEAADKTLAQDALQGGDRSAEMKRLLATALSCLARSCQAQANAQGPEAEAGGRESQAEGWVAVDKGITVLLQEIKTVPALAAGFPTTVDELLELEGRDDE